MPLYARVECDALTDPKLLAAGPEAFGIYVRGLLFSKIQLTDGFVPDSALAMLLLGAGDPDGAVAALVANDLWRRVEGGYTVGEERWARHQVTRAEVETKREQGRVRQQRHREASNALVTRDNSVTDDVSRVSHALVTQPKHRAQSTEHKEQSTERNGTAQDLVPLLPEHLRVASVRASWGEWLSYRKQRKFPKYKPLALEKLATQLKDLTPEAFVRSVDRSIGANWQGLFPEKNGKPEPNGKHELTADEVIAYKKARGEL